MKKLRWMALDNAAKIFPAAMRRNWSNVFRVSATLTEDIDTKSLALALERAVKRCPSIGVRLRAGFFWYYIQELPQPPQIQEEKPYPISRMPFDDIRQCAIRVLVHQKRIAVEFFHAVTDGNGGLQFVKTLVAEYLRIKYGALIPCEHGILDPNEPPKPEELEDAFQRNMGPAKASRAAPNSFRILGKREPDGYRTNTTFILDANEIHSRASEIGVTVTAYLSAVLVRSAMYVQDKTVKNPKRHQPVYITIPVNLRKMFPSKTLRNFILVANPGIDPRLGEYSFEEICHLLQHQMKLMITPKNMAAQIAKNVGDEKPLFLRAMPLFIKNIVMKAIFDAVGEKKSCFCFSNLGIVDVPEAYKTYVKRMDFVIGTQAQSPYNIGALTYGDKLYLNFIRNIETPILEQAFYHVLKELDIHTCAESNTRIGGEGYVLY